MYWFYNDVFFLLLCSCLKTNHLPVESDPKVSENRLVFSHNGKRFFLLMILLSNENRAWILMSSKMRNNKINIFFLFDIYVIYIIIPT